MTIDQAVHAFEVAARAVESEHPSLSDLVAGARASAKRISDRFKVDNDSRRADRELAGLLLDLGDAAEKASGVMRYMPPEHEGGPPGAETLAAVRGMNRVAYGVAGASRGVGSPTVVGAALGGALSLGSQQVFKTSIRSTNRLVDWFFEVFGGPDVDVELPQPVGTVTISPFGYGDPVKAALVVTAAFSLAAFVAWRVLTQCYGRCQPCERRHARGVA